MNKRPTVGLLGCLALCIGVFAPIVSAPFVSMSYFHDVKDHATYLMVLAGASIVTMLLQWYLLLWITGLACLGLIGLDFYSVQQHLAEEMQNGQNPLAALARMDWGWAVLFAGSAMLIVAAAMWKEERSPARNENAPRSAPQQ